MEGTFSLLSSSIDQNFVYFVQDSNTTNKKQNNRRLPSIDQQEQQTNTLFKQVTTHPAGRESLLPRVDLLLGTCTFVSIPVVGCTGPQKGSPDQNATPRSLANKNLRSSKSFPWYQFECKKIIDNKTNHQQLSGAKDKTHYTTRLFVSWVSLWYQDGGYALVVRPPRIARVARWMIEKFYQSM